MNQIKDINTNGINTKAIIFGMVLLFLCMQIGFHPTYWQYFPEFNQFTSLHHIHGALMASWMILLIVQPVLIHQKKYKTHRWLGKLSYWIAPLMIISMFLVLRFTYHKHVLEISANEEMSSQAPIIMQLFCFTILYVLAIHYRKQPFYHMRFMIGTALVMVLPTLGRIFYEYFEAEVWYELYLIVGMAFALMINDIRKHDDWKPYAIITTVLSIILFVYEARHTPTWNALGRFWANTFY